MIYDIPTDFEVELRTLLADRPTYRQVRVNGIPVAYAELSAGEWIYLIASCTDDILKAVRKRLESEAGCELGPFTATPQMVDDERERCEAMASDDEDDESPLWLPDSFTR